MHQSKGRGLPACGTALCPAHETPAPLRRRSRELIARFMDADQEYRDRSCPIFRGRCLPCAGADAHGGCASLVHCFPSIRRRPGTRWPVSCLATPPKKGAVEPPLVDHGCAWLPPAAGWYDWVVKSAGAAIQAAELLVSGRYSSVVSLMNGQHHAFPEKAGRRVPRPLVASSWEGACSD